MGAQARLSEVLALYREEVCPDAPAFKPQMCPASCPCQRDLPEEGYWSQAFAMRTLVRYVSGLATAIENARVPLDLEAASRAVWLRPHRWAVASAQMSDERDGAQSAATAWNAETARLLLASCGRRAPASCDPVLYLLTKTTLRAAEENVAWFDALLLGGRWCPTNDALLHLVGACPLAEACPVRAIQAGSSIWVASAPGSWGEWIHLPLCGPTTLRPTTESRFDTRDVVDDSHRAARDTSSSAHLGAIGEHVVHRALLAAARVGHPRARVQTTAHRPKSGDFMVETQVGRIIAEAKNYSRPVPRKEVEKLERDLEVCVAAAGLLIALGSGVAGMEGSTELRMVANASDGLSPLLIISLPLNDGEATCASCAVRTEEASLATACSLGLSVLILLAAEHPRGSRRLASSDLTESLVMRLEGGGLALGSALDAMKETMGAVLSTHQTGLSALATAKTTLSMVTNSVRSQLDAKGLEQREISLASWEEFVGQVGPVAEAEHIHALWPLISMTCAGRWALETAGSGTSRARTVTVARDASGTLQLKFLAASTRFVSDMGSLSGPGQQAVLEGLTNPVLQKCLKVTNGQLDIKVCGATRPLLDQLLRS